MINPDKWNTATKQERAFLMEGIKLTVLEYNEEISKPYDKLSDTVRKFINFPSYEEYQKELKKEKDDLD